jgi:hypothetical protein
MAIINMISNNAAEFPEGAICALRYNNSKADRGFVVVTYESEHGLCLEKCERNGYDDSDFYMIVWNPETGKAENITYASTRGWSYPCYASYVDATPDVRAAYDAACKAETRRLRIQGAWDARRAEMSLAAKAGITRTDVKRLRNAVGRNWDAVRRLLITNVRSGFKKSIRAQIIAWVQDPAPKFSSPLSPKQFQYL